jgi:EAL domain-containing protein (putative c-di-GMP-specific phosphodiesterase class I)
MARALGLLTLAEGVETQSQFQTLLELGCDQFQGSCSAGLSQRNPSSRRWPISPGAWREARQLTS